MNTLEQISDTKIRDIDSDRLHRWIAEEINTLANDYGQKLELDQVRHISSRLMGTFQSTKLKNWHPATIHNIFQLGITGQYGKATKVTYSILISWIWAHEKTTRSENKHYSTDDFVEKTPEYYKAVADRCLPFIKWCFVRDIDTDTLTPEQYNQLRDKFNEVGPDNFEPYIEHVPRYKPVGNFKKYLL